MSQETDSYNPLVPVPQGKRVLGMGDAFSLWFSLGIGLLVLQAGAFLVPGLSLVGALTAIIIGSLLGAGLLALAGVVGADTGLATMAALRPTLGVRGASAPAVMNIIQLVGWGTFEIIAMRDAADQLAGSNFGFSAPVVWTIVFGLAATGLAVLGPLSFVRKFLRRFGIWLILLGAVWLTWTLLSRHDLAKLFNYKGDGSVSLGGGIDIVAAMPLSWLPLIADYSRFGTSSRSVFKGTALGYLLANIWFFALGAGFALAARHDGQDLLLSALAAAGGGLALFMILIDETDNVFADVFSAGTSTASLVPVRVQHLVLGFGLSCTVLALVVPVGEYLSFLLLIGSVFAPLYGVLLTDHFLVRKRQIILADIDRTDGVYGRIHIPAFVAWVFGVGVFHGIAHFLPALGATIPALVASGVVYFCLKRVMR